MLMFKRLKTVAVCIPLYKQVPDEDELISLTQCFKLLSKHPIIFFCPSSLDLNFYVSLNLGNFEIKRFPDHYFKSIDGYNQLMLSKEFYRRFINFKYILIYQLDAFIFRDDLDEWCKKGYDYVAAPFIDFNKLETPVRYRSDPFLMPKYVNIYNFLNKSGLSNYWFRHVENGGFSLRKVSKFLFLLGLFPRKRRKWDLNEDRFYLYIFNKFFFLFNIPDEFGALNFSFELNPSACFKLNNNQLPFGCHAFRKYEPEFWSKYIQSKG